LGSFATEVLLGEDDTTTARGSHASPAPAAASSAPSPRRDFAAEPRAARALTLPYVAAVMGVDSMEWAMEMLDPNGDGVVGPEEFIASFTSCFAELNELQAALEGHGGTETALAWLADSFFVVLLALALCVVLDLNLQAVLIPFGTVLVSASFAIGPAVAQVMSSLLLVLVTRPFDVGDRITASGLFGGEEFLLVEKISVLTTSLKRVNNKVVIVPNHMLGAMHIENFKRSPPAVVKLEVTISAEADKATLEKLREGLMAFVRAHPTHWKPDIVFRIIRHQQRGVELAVIAFSHRKSTRCHPTPARATNHQTPHPIPCQLDKWQEVPQCYHEVYRLNLCLLELLQTHKVLYRAPDMRVEMVGGST
jgi:hypothetical protein